MNGTIGYQQMWMTLARILVILLCFPIHECAHAWMANKLGDPTGKRQGRITLNPLKHLDLWGTVSIFLFGVGFAKPVPVDVANFKNRKIYNVLTSLAGPLSNLLMALILLLAWRFFPTISGFPIIMQSVFYAAYINICLAIFNLIPIPPLDGSAVIMALLPDNTYYWLLRYERYSMYILWGLLLLFGKFGISPITEVSQRVLQFMVSVLNGL